MQIAPTKRSANSLSSAARLAGAAELHRFGWPRDRANPVQTRIESTFLEPARARHGPQRWGTGVASGGALTFRRAIAYALEETPA